MPPTRASLDPAELFRLLLRHDVEFVVIGGQAASIHGAGWPTYDLDIVVSTTERTMAGLAALIRMKRAANRPKDRQGLHLLEQALRKRDG